MRTFILIALLILSTKSFAQLGGGEDKPANIPTGDPFSLRHDLLAGQKENIFAKTPDDEVIAKSRDQIERELKEGMMYYKKKKYDKAYPILAELATWGIKEPQGLLGMMYIKGEHVDQSIETGLAWLGVATEIEMRDTKKNFDYIYGQLNDDQKKFIDQKVEKYRSRYGMEVQNLVCKKEAPPGSNIPKLGCLKKPGSTSPLYPIN